MFFGNCSKRYGTWCTSLVGPAGGGFGFTSPRKALCGVGNGFEVYFAMRRGGRRRRFVAVSWWRHPLGVA
eukprot:COSAG06_NODE_37312_length_436_cov_4.305638_1_plen_69_part_10